MDGEDAPNERVDGILIGQIEEAVRNFITFKN